MRRSDLMAVSPMSLVPGYPSAAVPNPDVSPGREFPATADDRNRVCSPFLSMNCWAFGLLAKSPPICITLCCGSSRKPPDGVPVVVSVSVGFGLLLQAASNTKKGKQCYITTLEHEGVHLTDSTKGKYGKASRPAQGSGSHCPIRTLHNSTHSPRYPFTQTFKLKYLSFILRSK